jgi:hypothetical protein
LLPVVVAVVVVEEVEAVEEVLQVHLIQLRFEVLLVEEMEVSLQLLALVVEVLLSVEE